MLTLLLAAVLAITPEEKTYTVESYISAIDAAIEKADGAKTAAGRKKAFAEQIKKLNAKYAKSKDRLAVEFVVNDKKASFVFVTPASELEAVSWINFIHANKLPGWVKADSVVRATGTPLIKDDDKGPMMTVMRGERKIYVHLAGATFTGLR